MLPSLRAGQKNELYKAVSVAAVYPSVGSSWVITEPLQTMFVASSSLFVWVQKISLSLSVVPV